MNKLEAALIYAKRNLAVFPVHSIDETGKCTCRKDDCHSPGKHPIWRKGDLEHGKDCATKDRDIITQWWTDFPNANIGLVTGKENNLVVIDIDPRHGGNESLEELQNAYEPMPQTRCAITGGGGYHYLFQYPKHTEIPNRANLVGYSGIDVRAEGGYILVAPSNHISGNKYKWSTDVKPIVEMPEWLIELCADKEPQNSESADMGREPLDLMTIIHGVPVGQRDDQIFRLACSLRAKNVPRDVAEYIVLQSAQNCEAPFPDKEALKKVERAYTKYEPSRNVEEAQTEDEKDCITALVRNAEQLISTPEEVEFLAGKIFPRGYVGFLFGESGIGKTWLTLDLAIDLCNGNQLWGRYNSEPLKVLYFEGDSPDSLIQRRLGQMTKNFSDPRNFEYLNRMEAEDEGFNLSLSSDIGRKTFKKTISNSKPDLVIVDTLVSFFDKDECSIADIKPAIDFLRMQARLNHCHILVCHHSRKRLSGERRDILDQSDMIGHQDLIA